MKCKLCDSEARGYMEGTSEIPAHVCILCPECCVWEAYWTAARQRGVQRPTQVLWPHFRARATKTN